MAHVRKGLKGLQCYPLWYSLRSFFYNVDMSNVEDQIRRHYHLMVGPTLHTGVRVGRWYRTTYLLLIDLFVEIETWEAMIICEFNCIYDFRRGA